MCLGIPARVLDIDGDTATVDVAGAKRRASMALLPGAGVGDYVIVHAGFAIEKIDTARAAETIEMIRAVADGREGGNN